jgi:hypothetical protein
VDVAIEEEVTDEDDEAHAAVETSQKRKNGSQSQSWGVWSRQARSRAWSRSTYTLYPSRNTKLSISSCPS